MEVDSRDKVRLWRLLNEVAESIYARQSAVSAQLGLTLPQAQVLCLLDPAAAVAIGKLAGPLACDASNVTGIVDRLDSLGLIERGFAERDRRVRTIALTERGAQLRAELLARLEAAPQSIVAATDAELDTLAGILDRLRRELGTAHR
jgi:DNA-binding MarR family transcriptional regulator